MANKEVLDQIKAEKINRITVLSQCDGAMTVLRHLTDSWLREADYLAAARTKGWQTAQRELQRTVALVKLDMIELEKRLNGATPPASGATIGGLEHANPVSIRSTTPAADPATLAALESDSKAAGRGLVGERCPNGNIHNQHTVKCACGYVREGGLREYLKTDGSATAMSPVDDGWPAMYPFARIEHITRPSASHPEPGWSSQCVAPDCPGHWRLGMSSRPAARAAYVAHLSAHPAQSVAGTMAAELSSDIRRAWREVTAAPEPLNLASTMTSAEIAQFEERFSSVNAALLPSRPMVGHFDVEVTDFVERLSEAVDEVWKVAHPHAVLETLRGDPETWTARCTRCDYYTSGWASKSDARVEYERHEATGCPLVVGTLDDVLTEPEQEQQLHREIKQMTDVKALFREAGASTPYARPVPSAAAEVIPRSWTELAAPLSATHPETLSTIPEHMSPSQLSTLDTCPAQYRLSRIEGLPRIPLWANVGGTAFHQCVEHIERAIAPEKDQAIDWVVWLDRAPALWKTALDHAIADTVQESGMEPDEWHASNRGKENGAWWGVEGGEMLKRYVQYRAMHGDDGRRVLTLPDGKPVIEAELHLTLDSGLLVKVIPDIVWLLPNGDIEIWDYKTRSDFGGQDPDTIQLGTQAHAVRALLNALERKDGHAWGTIRAGYYNARKGLVVDLHEPLERHPREELEMRYNDSDYSRRNRPAIPRRSNLCKACPVFYACPVGRALQ